MITLKWHETCNVSKEELRALMEQLEPEIKTVQYHRQTGYKTPYGMVNLPFDERLLHQSLDVARAKKEFNPALLIVVGIGGSHLGTLAFTKALYGTLYNFNLSLPVFFVDTVDADYISDVGALAQQALEEDETIIINVVSKSGTTTETIANFEILLDMLMYYHPDDYQNYIVVTTAEGSPLHTIAQQEDFETLLVPREIGGRFSVLSPVGAFPLAMLNVDVHEVMRGAQQAVKNGVLVDYTKNHALQAAAVRFINYKKNYTIQDLFIFAKALEGIGQWYRQLVGESLGKAFNKQGERVEEGITPTVSIGSTDLHSVGQLYLGGPRDKLFTFLTVNTMQEDVFVPDFALFDQCVHNIQDRSLATIMQAIIEGTQRTFKEDERPFFALSLDDISPASIGYIVQMMMIEIVYVGFLLEVNPFDQPQVEAYKRETRKMLAHE